MGVNTCIARPLLALQLHFLYKNMILGQLCICSSDIYIVKFPQSSKEDNALQNLKLHHISFQMSPNWLPRDSPVALSCILYFHSVFPQISPKKPHSRQGQSSKSSRLRGQMAFFCIEFFFFEFPMKFAIRNMYGTWYYNTFEKGPKSLYIATKRNQDFETQHMQTYFFCHDRDYC